MPLKSLDSFLCLKRTFRLRQRVRMRFGTGVSKEPRWRRQRKVRGLMAATSAVETYPAGHLGAMRRAVPAHDYPGQCQDARDALPQATNTFDAPSTQARPSAGTRVVAATALAS